MNKISKILARQGFDSRGNPTIEAEVFLQDGTFGSAIVPSGASTGSYEAFELKDKQNKDYLGKSVFKAVNNINDIISKKLKNFDVLDQFNLDKALIDLDGTKQKNNLGANSILAVSIASFKASAKFKKIPIYKNFKEEKDLFMPKPLMNIINGGAHANNSLKIQEFMIRPESSKSFNESIRMCFLIIQKLKLILEKKNYTTTVGDEGGFAPSLSSNEDAIELIIESIDEAGFKPGFDVSICLDIAANELYKDGKYSIRSSNFESSDKTIEYYKNLIKEFPISSIEDPFFEDDWDSFSTFKKSLRDHNSNIQIVGDDLFVTNRERLMKGIKQKAANAILIKPNQIGTVSETIEVIDHAHLKGFNTIMSHRSGDTEDSFIADFAVGMNCSQIKTGSLSRSERVSKYNRLIKIEEELGKSTKMAKVIK